MKIVTILKLNGEYNESHVVWLQKQLKVPIACITDSTKSIPNVTSIPMKHNFPGWWSKIEMFRPDLQTENFLYCDLDTVFLYGVPKKYEKLTETVVLSHVGRNPKDTINSGLMFINVQDTSKIWIDFKRNSKKYMKQFEKEGDQGFLNMHLYSAKRWQTLFPGTIVSYKVNILRHGFRGREEVVVFHGNPRPWNINARWIPKLCLNVV